jgi:DNA-binding transcriptional LysR family regulator
VQAPGVDLRCVSIHPTNVIDCLDRGEVDLALGGFVGIAAERVTRTMLFEDRFVGVARQGHPLLHGGRMSVDDFAEAPHALMSFAGEPRGDIDHALSTLGIERRIAITAPNFLALPFIIEKADIIGVLPERLASRAAESASLALFDLPITVDPVTCNMLTLAPLNEQAEMRWLFDLLKKAATSSG